MAKNSKTKSSQGSRRSRRNRNVQVPRPRLALGSAAARYAALVADPCNAPLIPAPIGDGSGSMVARFERDVIIGAETGAAAVAFGFVPSDPRSYGPFAVIGTDNATFAWNDTFFTGFTPGKDFLLANAQAFRAISCCLQVYWPGKELERSGIISLARVNADLFTANTRVDELRSNSQYIERMPSGCAEIVWRPSEFDMQMTEPEGTGATTPAGRRLTGLLATASGYPAGTGMRVRIVVAYEWIPKQTSGFKLSSHNADTGVTLGSVLNMLDRTGDWMYHSGQIAARAMSSAAAGVGSIYSTVNGARRLGQALLSM